MVIPHFEKLGFSNCLVYSCIAEILRQVQRNRHRICSSNRKSVFLLRFKVIRTKPIHLGLQKGTLLLMFLANRVWIDLERLSSLFLFLGWNQLHIYLLGDL